MEVIQLKNPGALVLPEVAELLRRAITKTQNITDFDLEAVAPDVIAMVRAETSFVFLGEEAGHFKLLAMGFLPTLRLYPRATITTFYNEGSKALRDEGKRIVLDYIGSKGYNAWAVNGTGNTDKAWLKVFNTPGWEIKPVGTFFELKKG